MRWKNRPEGSNWGDFGADDQRGKMNLLTPAMRLAAMQEVREGIAFTLSLPLDYPGGDSPVLVRRAPKLFSTQQDGHHAHNLLNGDFMPGSCGSVCDDGVTLYTQYSTQWDSLAHWGRLFDLDGDGRQVIAYYNGFRAVDDIIGAEQDGGPYAKALGIQNLAEACPQGRGVLVNMFAIHGHHRMGWGYDHLMDALDRQKAEVRPGDFLVIYTGWDVLLLCMNKQPSMPYLLSHTGGLDGHDDRLLQWIDDSGIVAICSDNAAVELFEPRIGPRDETGLRLHEHCLFKLGIHLGELWYLKDLADWLGARERSAFLLTAPPLRLPGAVGSPACPIATV
jgi:kynurenine formamidase